MKLTNEFDVAAPPLRTWPALLDVPRVARALPGATIEAEPEGGAWRGAMQVRIGPVTSEYAGTARVQDVDEDERVASFRVEGREVRGQGTAAATITTRVLPQDGGGTHVVVETDMAVTGRQAQLGRRLLEDVAGSLFAEFADRLEQELSGRAATGGAPEALDVGGAVRGALAERAALFAAGLGTGVLLGFALCRRTAQ